jgi:hypothetical protein
MAQQSEGCSEQALRSEAGEIPGAVPGLVLGTVICVTDSCLHAATCKGVDLPSFGHWPGRKQTSQAGLSGAIYTAHHYWIDTLGCMQAPSAGKEGTSVYPGSFVLENTHSLPKSRCCPHLLQQWGRRVTVYQHWRNPQGLMFATSNHHWKACSSSSLFYRWTN